MEETNLKKWLLIGGKLKKVSRKHWKENKKLQVLYPYLLEEQVKRKISISKLLMIVIVGFMIFNLGKQFFYKNILFPSTLIVEKEEKVEVKNNNLPEIITNIVKDNLEANKIIENKVVIQTVEIIKEIIVMVTPTPRPYKEYKGIYSWYYPPLGGINCDTNPDGTEECIYMANGDKWEKWEDIGCACPQEWEFGTEIYIKELNLTLTCVDRGAAIIKDENNNYWIDHLTNNPLLYWSTPITLIIYE